MKKRHLTRNLIRKYTNKRRIEKYRVDHVGIVQLVASRLKSDTLKNYNHKMRRQSCKALRISVITEIHFTHKHVRVTMLFSLYLTKIYIIIYICARSLVLWFEHCGMTELYHMRGTLEVVL